MSDPNSATNPARPDVWITAAARTAVTGRSRAQAHLSAGELAAQVVAGVSTGDPAEAVGAVVLGNCTGPGGNLGRIAALSAGLGITTPGWSVDGQCGSGLLAVITGAAHAAATGAAVVAGGVESPSTAPQRSLDGVPYTQAPMTPAGWPDPGMTAAADALAEQAGILRSRQEAFAVASHAKALTARRRGLHAGRLGQVPDDGPRALTRAMVARFPTAENEAEPDWAHTAATAARIADGAAAVRLEPHVGQPRTREVGDDTGLTPVRILASALTGDDPALPGAGAVAAMQYALQSAGTTLAELAAVEVVEAYAAQTLYTLDALGVAEDDPRVNAWGGALALGHPWGASGAIALTTLIHRLHAEPTGSRGAVCAAVAGGMGVALIVERA
ncbi:MAG: acetyl-CoA C-acyltransferase [Micrococcus sp.]|nr:acetyl-CoA C-acyltransferase [Micrococcus sp.]